MKELLSDTRINLQPGEEVRWLVRGYGSAGYAWDFEVVQGAKVIEVELTGTKPPVKEAGTRDENTHPYNCNVDMVIHLKALSTGSALVKLLLKRPWETQPIKSITLEVMIQKPGI